MRQNQPLLIPSVTPAPPQANMMITISEIIGSAWAEASEEGLCSNTDHTDSQQLGTKVWRSCVTWSWWSKNVLIHVLEPASQTFTLLSDELGKAEDRQYFERFLFLQHQVEKLLGLKFYLETKWVSSGEKATLRTQDPCPLRVPAKLACCL